MNRKLKIIPLADNLQLKILYGYLCGVDKKTAGPPGKDTLALVCNKARNASIPAARACEGAEQLRRDREQADLARFNFQIV